MLNIHSVTMVTMKVSIFCGKNMTYFLLNLKKITYDGQ